jgi:hypothetical protein
MGEARDGGERGWSSAPSPRAVQGRVLGRWGDHAILLAHGGNKRYEFADPPWPPSRIPPTGVYVELALDGEGLVLSWHPVAEPD